MHKWERVAMGWRQVHKRTEPTRVEEMPFRLPAVVLLSC